MVNGVAGRGVRVYCLLTGYEISHGLIYMCINLGKIVEKIDFASTSTISVINSEDIAADSTPLPMIYTKPLEHIRCLFQRVHC